MPFENSWNAFDKIKPEPTIKYSLLDLRPLEKLCDGDKKFMQRMIIVFINDVPTIIKKIRTALSQKNCDEIKLYAHRIKPSVQNTCIKKIYDEVVWIEKTAEKNVVTPELEKKVIELEKSIKTVVQQLKSELNNS